MFEIGLSSGRCDIEKLGTGGIRPERRTWRLQILRVISSDVDQIAG